LPSSSSLIARTRAAVQEFNAAPAILRRPNLVFSQKRHSALAAAASNNPVGMSSSSRSKDRRCEARTPSSRNRSSPWKRSAPRGCYHHPLSEESSIAPMRALARCWRETRGAPALLYALGMAALIVHSKMLKALGFSLTPFRFTFTFASGQVSLEMQALRRSDGAQS